MKKWPFSGSYLAILLVLVVFMLLIIGNLSAAKSSVKSRKTIAISSNQGTIANTRSYCSDPVIIGPIDSGGSPKIEGRYIVYSLNGVITFYDLVSERVIQPFMPPAGKRDLLPQISGSNILFLRDDQGSRNEELMIYSLGPNGVVNPQMKKNDIISSSLDDVGPVAISSRGNVPSFSIRGDLVTFRSSRDYYCEAQYPGGSCWNQNLQQIQAGASFPQSASFHMAIGDNGYNFFIWKDLFWSVNWQGWMGSFYFIDSNNNEGPLYNDPNTNVEVEDISWPFVIYRESRSPTAYPPISGETTIIKMGFIQNPLINFDITSGSNYDMNVRVGHNPGFNGEVHLAWNRYTYLASTSGIKREIVATSFPSKKEVVIKRIPMNPFRYIAAGVPDVDENNVVWAENNNRVFLSKCYL